jgi:hypothetical protein
MRETAASREGSYVTGWTVRLKKLSTVELAIINVEEQLFAIAYTVICQRLIQYEMLL